MVSDVIHVMNDGGGIAEALSQAEKCAAYRELGQRDTLHLRLFAEEMLGMMRALTGEREGEFRIESEGRRFRLYLKVSTSMNTEKRRMLLNASSTGKNDAAKGFMGRIRDVFERAFEHTDGAGFAANEPFLFAVPYGAEAMANVWTLTRYKRALSEGENREEWDELEHSVISKLADEVRVGIESRDVEMIVEKTF